MAQYGCGHHIARDDMILDLLISEIKRIPETYLSVYIEPGEAIA